MGSPAGTTNGMRTSFHDFDPGNHYDARIGNTRTAMAGFRNPCESLEAMRTLILELETTRASYRSRPCPEGLCFGLMTPHRARISRRIELLTSEANHVFEPACQRYLADKNAEDERKLRRELKSMELDARSSSTRTRTSTEKQTGVWD